MSVSLTKNSEMSENRELSIVSNNMEGIFKNVLVLENDLDINREGLFKVRNLK